MGDSNKALLKTNLNIVKDLIPNKDLSINKRYSVMLDKQVIYLHMYLNVFYRKNTIFNTVKRYS